MSFILSFNFSSCSSSDSKEEESDNTKENAESETSSNIQEPKFELITKKVEGIYEIGVPDFMEEMPNLNKRASLQYGSDNKQLFLVVIHWDKEEDGISEDIDEYYKIAVEELSGAIEEATSEDPAEITSKGMQLRRGTLSGYFNDIPIVYYINVVETEGFLYEMVMWTAQEDMEEFQPLMDAVYESFTQTK